ncbi:hypothetical protein IGI04_002362 [Brassica rapa subsp. trilocularis]|uniref:Uncharacterized protein n=1 Tax=Brassica rapa subsp. trilocularis TaxID=1813537 RepID=A0ABQ7NVA8_BRACM|nr:hypothetical protein IGI04_002362 [Brassica rapa subsp. trilocularis]
MTLLPMSRRIKRDPRENEVAAAASRLTKPTKKKRCIKDIEIKIRSKSDGASLLPLQKTKIGARLFCPRSAELEDKKKVSEQRLSQQ